MKKDKYPQGATVLAPDAEGELRKAEVLESLSSMIYIRFEEGDERFVFRTDKRLKLDG